MKRPHPYLALALACAAVVLVTISALACPAAAQVYPPATWNRSAVDYSSPYPQGGAFVYDADPRCPTIGRVVPDLPTALCMRTKAIEYLVREVAERRVVPGPDFHGCDGWADFAWPSCIDWYLHLHTPEIRWGLSPVWVLGHIGGVPWEGCAAGAAYPTYVRVSLYDTSRIMRLASWETSNSLLAYRLDLRTSADGPITSAATNYAAAACGVN